MPPRAIYSPAPDYDQASRDAKIEGKVRVTIVVKTDGLVRDAKISRGLSEGLNKNAIEAVSRWKFAPATKDGKPVTVQIDVDFTFKL